MYPQVTVKNHHERRLLKGHLWAFSNELAEIPKDLEAGNIVTLVREFDKKPFALAFYHPHSLIAARIISRDPADEITSDFLQVKIEESAARRAFLWKERNAVRLVHGESDLLPGLIIERYNDIITFQITSSGFEKRKEDIISIIDDLFTPQSIIEKNISHLRKLEGLEEVERVVKGTETETEIHDGLGTRFRVSLLKGQKTGSYLDQMENRTALRRYMNEGMRALDLFTNTGGFAMNMALAGASEVTAIDQSEEALAACRTNAELNEVSEKIRTIHADCFSYLKKTQEKFDCIVLDPPSLVRSKKELKNAEKGYFALHRDAIRSLAPGGLLVTASCSHHFTRELFLDCVRKAASTEKRAAVILEERGAAADHPVHIYMPETEYLKVFYIKIA